MRSVVAAMAAGKQILDSCMFVECSEDSNAVVPSSVAKKVIGMAAFLHCLKIGYRIMLMCIPRICLRSKPRKQTRKIDQMIFQKMWTDMEMSRLTWRP